ncbi:MAG: response regulator [Candidatus Rokubacteria bacterium]|nr:response regulator [Candidatus Rokubacteria bacterium]
MDNAAITVLIADKLKALLQIEKTFLMRAGFEVLTAENGETAVELAREKVPRLILLELDIPQMDGAMACAAMRRESSLALTPIILMSASVSPQIRDRCLKAGCTEFVVKPRKPEELLAIVARILSIRERKALRVRVVFNVTGDLNHRRMLGKATNLSGTGLLLLSDTTVPLGSALELEFAVPKTDYPVKVKGKVVRVGWNADGTCEAGIHFIDLSQTDQQQILEFTSS